MSSSTCQNKVPTSVAKNSINTSDDNNNTEPADLINLHVVSSMRPAFDITLSKSSALRDIHLQISVQTSLSRSFFKLSTETKPMPDDLTPISELGIENGHKIYLNVNIESGILKNKVKKLTIAQKAIRAYVYQMKAEEIKKFFSAEHTVFIRLTLPNGLGGRLKFKLDKPLNEDPKFYAPALEQVFVRGQTGRIRGLRQTGESSFKGMYHGDLPPEVFDSKCIPGKTVDTIVSILDNLISTV